MTLQSLSNLDGILTPIEVEISLLPGLPNIQVVGLPDAAIKESAIKVKAAIRSQGFEFPKARTVIINLRPSNIRKSSQGLELAMVLGILMQTNQIKFPCELHEKKCLIYGEINLHGEVFCPEDIRGFGEFENESSILVTGENSYVLGVDQYQIKTLAQIANGQVYKGQEFKFTTQRPNLSGTKFTKEQARLMSIVAAGEHPLLLVGPSGTGKSTFIHQIPSLLRPPSSVATKEIYKLWKGKIPPWRPVVSPHHSATMLAMVGGGVPPKIGEVSRAHGGTLLMDEFLEYRSEVFEALREPIETGKIVIARGSFEKVFPAKFLLLATSNLCKCGNYVPKRSNKCICTNRDKQLYFSRFNGPMLDRVSVIAFTDGWDKMGDIGLERILDNVNAAIKFSQKTRSQELPNHNVEFSDLKIDEKIGILETSSRRRLKLFKQVLRTIADLEGCKTPKSYHFEEASQLCLKSHQRITTQLALY
ncbi:MAG: hypothetical protein A4S09_07165 [Proteobacteria bacterium SG_bin7]|nr:MAG: hypothetical protein A4S09_07165 [Proteobacteria bacterium SG_bin7]